MKEGIYFCPTHFCELEKIGWVLMSEKYDYLEKYLSAFGHTIYDGELIKGSIKRYLLGKD